MLFKTRAVILAFFLFVLTLSCSKSPGTIEPGHPPAGATSFAITVAGTTYNLDSVNVMETSSGYYIRAIQKGTTDVSSGVSLFLNAKASSTHMGFGNTSETGKAYVSGNLGAGKNFSSSYSHPATGNVTTSSGGVNFSVTNGVLTVSFTGALFTVTGETIPVSVSLQLPRPTETADDPANQFFDFEFNSATYTLQSLAISPYDKGYIVMGIVSNSIVTLVINTKASNTSVSFGDMENAGTSGALFNIPAENVYKTTGRDCFGREIVHNQGQAKLTSIGNVGGFIEGHISGAAFKNENACNGDGKTIESKPFRGSFKIRRIM